MKKAFVFGDMCAKITEQKCYRQQHHLFAESRTFHIALVYWSTSAELESIIKLQASSNISITICSDYFSELILKRGGSLAYNLNTIWSGKIFENFIFLVSHIEQSLYTDKLQWFSFCNVKCLSTYR